MQLWLDAIPHYARKIIVVARDGPDAIAVRLDERGARREGNPTNEAPVGAEDLVFGGGAETTGRWPLFAWRSSSASGMRSDGMATRAQMRPSRVTTSWASGAFVSGIAGPRQVQAGSVWRMLHVIRSWSSLRSSDGIETGGSERRMTTGLPEVVATMIS